MELNQAEITVVERTIEEVNESIVELHDLQLALVGGGIGTVVVG